MKKHLSVLVAALLLGCDSGVQVDNADDGLTTSQPAPPDPAPAPAPAPAPTPTPTPTPLAPGERADWLRGSWGINWKPVDLYNGASETITADRILEQVSEFRTIDYLQLHLGDSSVKSSVHLSPHDVLESLWQGDLGEDGKPRNLIVPRAAANIDPFFDMLKATKAAGLKTMIYINSSTMMLRSEDDPNPEPIPNITERFMEFCDTDPQAQVYLNSQSYHRDDAHPIRPYMFCYAEFVLKDYSIRYGDVVDGWLFDSGRFMVDAGDNATSGIEEEQRVYKAFSDASRAGNPNAAISFNNGPERVTEELNPFSAPVLHEDYMFGHPYNGGQEIGDHASGRYLRNYAHMQKITETRGNVHVGGERSWDDKVLGHFDPPMSTTSWNGGSVPALTDDEFTLWSLEATRDGGAITWGAPLVNSSRELNHLLIRDWGMRQLTLMDSHLSINQEPGAPNWARAETPLMDAAFGQDYIRTLVNSVDFWDPEFDAVTLSIIGDDAPAWLSVEPDPLNTGDWVLSGRPTETSPSSYSFSLRAEDASGFRDRQVQLKVGELVSVYPYKGNVEIQATANTDYGVDKVATMTSEVLTAPDQLATFQIAFDVTPRSGEKIVSGVTASETTSTSWGVNDGQFKGSDNESVEPLDNIHVVNFNANGGSLAKVDIQNLSFEYVTVAHAQSSGDRILIEVDGLTNADGGEGVASKVDQLDLRILGYVPITRVALGVGNDKTSNSWSINNINVSYVIQEP